MTVLELLSDNKTRVGCNSLRLSVMKVSDSGFYDPAPKRFCLPDRSNIAKPEKIKLTSGTIAAKVNGFDGCCQCIPSASVVADRIPHLVQTGFPAGALSARRVGPRTSAKCA